MLLDYLNTREINHFDWETRFMYSRNSDSGISKNGITKKCLKKSLWIQINM